MQSALPIKGGLNKNNWSTNDSILCAQGSLIPLGIAVYQVSHQGPVHRKGVQWGGHSSAGHLSSSATASTRHDFMELVLCTGASSC